MLLLINALPLSGYKESTQLVALPAKYFVVARNERNGHAREFRVDKNMPRCFDARNSAGRVSWSLGRHGSPRACFPGTTKNDDARVIKMAKDAITSSPPAWRGSPPPTTCSRGTRAVQGEAGARLPRVVEACLRGCGLPQLAHAVSAQPIQHVEEGVRIQ